jgi:hypothetical protein
MFSNSELKKVSPTKESTQFPLFPFNISQENNRPHLYFVSMILSDKQIRVISNLYNHIPELKDLQVDIWTGEPPYADGSKLQEYHFREETVMSLCKQLQGYEEEMVSQETCKALLDQFREDCALCFYFKEYNHPDLNRYIERNGSYVLNDGFSTYVVLSNTSEQAYQFISSLSFDF